MNQDHRLGFASEEQLCENIRRHFGEDLQATTRWCPFDYESPTTVAELKTRRCASTQYPDTMVSHSKIKKIPPGKRCLLLFQFTDGLFYHEYDPIIPYRIASGGRFDRGRPELSEYLYVPVTHLKAIGTCEKTT